MAKPVTEVDDYSGKESGLSRAEQKSQPVKLSLRLYEAHKYGDDAPGNHDAGNPAPRTPFFDDNAAWNLQQEISDEEDAGAKTDHLVVELKVGPHLQSGKANIHSIEIGNDVEQKQVRHQSAHDAPAASMRDRIHFDLLRWIHFIRSQ
jgi:hypothetical protein